MGDSARADGASQSKQSGPALSARSSLNSNFRNLPLSRLSSLKTHTSSSKHTAFYSAQSHLGDSSTASYHTADDATTDMPQQRFGGWAPQHKQQVEEDENL
ncbi:hypothetical protein IWW55_007246, partial [Coemansia sp. RSA 2706]